jgi:sugar phosphate permease
MRKRFMRKGAAAVVVALMMLSVGSASAQTQGMERRDERHDDRSGARATKQECKAGDEKTRAECRQTKRTTKQQGRHDGGQQETPASATQPAQ